jgi:hypothetical protein
MKWFRLYHEIIEDMKVGTLSDAEFRTWIELLCLASIKRDGGDTGMSVTEAEWKLRRNVSETVKKLLQRKLVALHKNGNGDETLHICKWNKRQFQSDSSTERVKKFRNQEF